jgi:hypothetical protein
MQIHYIVLNIPKALYFLNKNLNFITLVNKVTKKYISFFCYNFICLFINIEKYFINFRNNKINKIFFNVYKQFILQYLTIFFYLFGGYRLKLLTVGSGYFFEEISKNIVNFYLGYSHLITLETQQDTLLTVVGRKQRILIIQNKDFTSLRNLGFLIKNLYLPDKYRGKGIRYYNEIVILKKGKKKFV